MARFAVILVALLACSPAFGQDESPSSFADLLSAAAVGPKKLSELDATWQRVEVYSQRAAQASSGELMGQMIRAYGGAGARSLFYIQGRWLTLGGQRYLIAYAAEGPALNLAGLLKMGDGGPPTPDRVMNALMPEVGPDAPLAVSLLDVRRVAQIRNVGPFALKQAAAERAGLDPSIAITAAVLFPVFAQAREKARETSSLSNLKQIGLGAMMYSVDHDDVLPPAGSLAAAKRALMPYLKDQLLFSFPGTNAAYTPNPSASRRRIATIRDPATFILFYESVQSGTGTRGVVFADGHAKRFPEADWPRVKALGGVP